MTHLHQIFLWIKTCSQWYCSYTSNWTQCCWEMTYRLIHPSVEAQGFDADANNFKTAEPIEAPPKKILKYSHKTCLLEKSMISLKFANKWQTVIVLRQSQHQLQLFWQCLSSVSNSQDHMTRQCHLSRTLSLTVTLPRADVLLTAGLPCEVIPTVIVCQPYGCLFSFWVWITGGNRMINKIPSLRVRHDRHIEHNRLEATPTA